MKTVLAPIIVLLLIEGLCAAAPVRTSFAVKYISSESVYLDGGQADGLVLGDTLSITGKSGSKAILVVSFIAEHSASCAVAAGQLAGFEVGDRAELESLKQTVVQPPAVDTTTHVQPREITPAPVTKPVLSKPPETRINGVVSFLFYSWGDRSSSDLNFTQSTARLDLRARRLWGREINFSLRSRGRYDQRQRAYSSLVGKNAWENRLWELSLSYDDPNAPFNAALGRVLPRRVGGIGYIDGLLVEAKASSHVRVGVFGGSDPVWAYNEGQLSLMKGGGYLTYLYGAYDKVYLEQSIAGVGEYHGSLSSREYLSLQGRMNVGSRWGFNNTADIDVNRSWRRDRSQHAVTLSNIYLGTYYRITNAVRASISYDNRRNYWSLENRSVVDSLFDDRLRQGGRGQLDIAWPHKISTSMSYGYNKRDGDAKATQSYSLFVSRYGLWRPGSSLSGQYAGFTGPFEKGYNFTARINAPLTNRAYVGLAYGSYVYSVTSESVHRKNNWVELSTQADMSRRAFTIGSLQFNSGDDIKGIRFQFEIGLRF
ncbi:MAG TPA: hypothetical protein VMS71_03720 [Candidatus Acidoferrum sp.]|nr:hypothetical protein [Candidatus Acidoferrum sp.]